MSATTGHETPADLFDSGPTRIIESPAKASLGSMTADDVEAAVASGGSGTNNDPLAGRFKTEGEIAITGNVDPVFGRSGLAIGDRIYHKLLKCEGTVEDLMASGKVIVKLDNGKKGTTAAENIAKL
jgi:hypothetical protein